MRSLLVPAVLLVACTQPAPPSTIEGTSHVVHMELPFGVTREIDLLFVIDDSPAMAAHQANLTANYARLMTVLETMPLGLPDVHIGVTTTDPADGGRLRERPAMSEHFLASELLFDGSRQTNFTGDLGQAFTELASVGAAGSATTTPFDAIRLGISDAVNPGFIRPDAYLLVVVLTAGDDASAISPEQLASLLKTSKSDPSKVIVAAALGACDANGRTATAAPRLSTLLEQFPNRSTRTAICDDDLSRVLELGGGLVKTTLGAPCVPVPLLDVNPDLAGTQPECAVWLTNRDQPTTDDLVLATCDSDHAPPCWRMIDDPAQCFDPPHQKFELAPAAFPGGTILILECLAE